MKLWRALLTALYTKSKSSKKLLPIMLVKLNLLKAKQLQRRCSIVFNPSSAQHTYIIEKGRLLYTDEAVAPSQATNESVERALLSALYTESKSSKKLLPIMLLKLNLLRAG